MTTRLDLAIQKYPDHEAAIRTFAERDPSGNLKYLHWQIKVLASGQALAPEIADVVELFHKFNGQWYTDGRRRNRLLVRRDIYSYRPQDLAHLRDALLKTKRVYDKKRRERERLYRIDGKIEADVVYESDALVVRHIKNKQASVHYGLGTRWCISMNREEYFSDYDTQNAIFFFIERKSPLDDSFDKCAVMIGRSENSDIRGFTCFDATDEQMDVLHLAKVYGTHIFDIFRMLYERSESYPGSSVARVLAGTATAEQLEQVFTLVREHKVRDVGGFMEAICCNDAATWTLLEQVTREAEKILRTSYRRRGQTLTFHRRRGAQRRRRWTGERSVKALSRTIGASLVVHPNVPPEMRESIAKTLRRANVNTDSIHIDKSRGSVCVTYRMRGERELGRKTSYRSYRRRRRASYRSYRRRRRWRTPSQLSRRVGMLERAVKRTKKQLQKAKREQAEKKAKKARLDRLKIAREKRAARTKRAR